MAAVGLFGSGIPAILLFSGIWGWMDWVSQGLYFLLRGIHYLVPDWGVSIILLAFVVRMVLYPLSKKAMIAQMRFVEAQKAMAPEMAEIKRNFKGGEQSERILELYKTHSVSPFAGLKPLLIVLVQLPILIALFQVLGSAEPLKTARFLWIDSLAAPDGLFPLAFRVPLLGDRFNLLPVLMAVFTLLSFKLAPAPATDEKGGRSQNLFLVAMTLVFFVLFYSFPSGLVLYWTFANVFHILQYRIMVFSGARMNSGK